MAPKMSQSQNVTPAATSNRDSDRNEPCLTDNEAALILLEMRQAAILSSPYQHHQDGSMCQSQGPVHAKSDSKNSGLATELNRDPATPQSIGHHSVATCSNAASDYECPGLDERAKFPSHALDETVSKIWSENEYETAREITPSENIDHDLDERLSDITSDSEYHTAMETTPSERLDYDSDADISVPEEKHQNAWETTLSTILDCISDGTISDPESEDECEIALKTTLSTIADHDLDDDTREAAPSKIDDSDSDATVSGPAVSGPELEDDISDPRESSLATAARPISGGYPTTTENAIGRMPKMHLCSLCKQPGHIHRHCPTIPCTYKGCNKRGHISTNCPKRQEDRNIWQKSYASRKRKEAAAAKSKTTSKKSKKGSTGREVLTPRHCGLCKEVGHNRRACPNA